MVGNIINDDPFLKYMGETWDLVYPSFKQYKVCSDTESPDLTSETVNINHTLIISEIYNEDNSGYYLFPNIIFRASFALGYPEIYSKLKTLESFNIKGFEEYMSKIKLNREYALHHNFNVFGLNYYYISLLNKGTINFISDLNVRNIEYLIDNILQFDNLEDIFTILFTPKIKEHIQQILSYNYVYALICDDESYSLNRVFKYLYNNDLLPTVDYIWELLSRTIELDNFELFNFIVERDTTWKNNPEFDEKLLEVSKHKDISKYTRILSKY
jgi:hypothetical protein